MLLKKNRKKQKKKDVKHIQINCFNQSAIVEDIKFLQNGWQEGDLR